jgi:tetratricopeptide (TPR) repeat protein
VRRARTLPLLLVLVPAALAGRADTVADLLREGDALYARRAEGAEGGSARPETIDAAMASYRRALSLDATSLAARWRFLRAVFFRAAFCPAPREETLRRLEEARRLGDEGVATLRQATRTLSPSARTEALRRTPDAAEMHFWTAVCWGQWALLRGKLAAARDGAGPKVRDLAQAVIELDPQLEQGGGDRVLGRLHHQAPRIPLLTGWVSRKEALGHLRRALALGPDNTVNQLFLAEAILDHEPEHAQEARQLLERCALAPPRPDFLVEDAHFSSQARDRLKTLR